MGTSLSCFLCSSMNVRISRARRPVQYNLTRFFYRCRSCGSYSLWPKLEEWESKELYSTSYIDDVKSPFHSASDRDKNRFTNLENFLKNFDTPHSVKFLDYGCGAGAENLIFASEIGITSFGVEIAPETRIQASLISGCEVLSPVDLCSMGPEFDVIFLGDVIEHVSDPAEVLNSIRKVLKPNGYLVIQGPLEGVLTLTNVLVLLKGVLLKHRPSLSPPYHVSLATRKSIRKLLANVRCKEIEFEITEPVWPAPELGSKESFETLSKLFLSLSKSIDVFLQKLFPNRGTRFFVILKSID